MVHLIEKGVPAATSALRAFAASQKPEVGNLTLRVFDPLTPQLVKEQWRQCALSGKNRARYDGVKDLCKWLDEHNHDREAGLTDGGWNLAIRQRENLLAVVLGRTRGDALRVTRVFGAPENNPLRGSVLPVAHLAATIMAKEAGLSKVVYDGPFSHGSIKQVERGAIPLTASGRQAMWLGEDVEVRLDQPAPTKLGGALVLKRVSATNRGLFRAMFAG